MPPLTPPLTLAPEDWRVGPVVTPAPPIPTKVMYENEEIDVHLRIKRISSQLEKLGPDELDVAQAIVDGLVRGRLIYGELRATHDKRNFVAEAGEELRDALVYIGAQLVRQSRKGWGEAPRP